MKLNIGENIRTHRQKMNITQQQLAEMLGVSYQAVSRWERGGVYPDIEMLAAIAELFCVSVDSLMGIKELEKEKSARLLIDELVRETHRENADIEHIASLICRIRRDHIRSGYIVRMWTGTAVCVMKEPKVLEEIRVAAEMVLSNSTSSSLRNAVIFYMAVFEEEKEVDRILQAHASSINISKNELLKNRYLLRGEWDMYEPYRACELYSHINKLFGSYGIWNDRTAKPTLEDSRLLNDLGMDFINRICMHTPTDKYPISYNGQVDAFVRHRLFLGFRGASVKCRSGEKDAAFVLLDDAVRTLECLMEITTPIRICCPCRYMDKLVFMAKEVWTDDHLRGGQERGVCIYTENVGEIAEYVRASWFYDMLTDKNANPGFDPLRSDRRFDEYVRRIHAVTERRGIKNG